MNLILHRKNFKKNLPLKEQVSLTILTLIKEYSKKGYSSLAINCGICDEFAEQLERIFPQGRAVWGDEIRRRFPKNVDPDGHCFFFCDGYYFDSECQQGVTEPHLLPFFQRGILRQNNCLTQSLTCDILSA
jgi:hypothetical protein